MFNYACFVSLLQKEGFSYKREKSDYLESVSEFVRNKGGDCDDWAFFAYSLMHFLKKRGITKIIFANGIANITYPAEICYSNITVGHCIVALCDKELRPKENASCILIEPQNGKILKLSLKNLNISIIISDKVYYLGS